MSILVSMKWFYFENSKFCVHSETYLTSLTDFFFINQFVTDTSFQMFYLNLAETNTCWRCQNETGIPSYYTIIFFLKDCFQITFWSINSCFLLQPHLFHLLLIFFKIKTVLLFLWKPPSPPVFCMLFPSCCTLQTQQANLRLRRPFCCVGNTQQLEIWEISKSRSMQRIMGRALRIVDRCGLLGQQAGQTPSWNIIVCFRFTPLCPGL